MGVKKINEAEKSVSEQLKVFAEMLVKQPREFMTFEEFREKVCDWSDDTLRRRIENEDFPAIRDKGGYLIPRDACKAWFKKRTTKE